MLSCQTAKIFCPTNNVRLQLLGLVLVYYNNVSNDQITTQQAFTKMQQGCTENSEIIRTWCKYGAGRGGGAGVEEGRRPA